jgi:ATP-dependent RNA helicase MSS116
MGFSREIEGIAKLLPKERRTFMFSATISDEIKRIAKTTLHPGYDHIDCVPKNQLETHLKIKQSYSIVPYAEQPYLVQDIISKHKKSHPASKIIVFVPSTSAVGTFCHLLDSMPGIATMMLHSKLSQPQRSRISDQFRRSRSSVLVTTDVSARGVDYPGVTLVIQAGLPSNRDQYIHRIGRTGRADKDGEAILILSPYEKRYLESVKDLPIRLEMRFNSTRNAQDKTRAEMINETFEKLGYAEKRAASLSFLAFRIFALFTIRLIQIEHLSVEEGHCD